jgi:PI31 proteasome regulator N-terminal
MAQDPLSPSKIISIVNESATSIPSPLEAIAAFSHACMLGTGFRFLGFGEDHKTGIS